MRALSKDTVAHTAIPSDSFRDGDEQTSRRDIEAEP